jgi:hypothetical protein
VARAIHRHKRELLRRRGAHGAARRVIGRQEPRLRRRSVVRRRVFPLRRAERAREKKD